METEKIKEDLENKFEDHPDKNLIIGYCIGLFIKYASPPDSVVVAKEIETGVQESLEGHQAWFRIGNQTFNLEEKSRDVYDDTLFMAKWYEGCLKVAFGKLSSPPKLSAIPSEKEIDEKYPRIKMSHDNDTASMMKNTINTECRDACQWILSKIESKTYTPPTEEEMIANRNKLEAFAKSIYPDDPKRENAFITGADWHRNEYNTHIRVLSSNKKELYKIIRKNVVRMHCPKDKCLCSLWDVDTENLEKEIDDYLLSQLPQTIESVGLKEGEK